MSYNKQNFIKGQILKADHLNAMETGIEANDQAIAELTEEMAKQATPESFGAKGDGVTDDAAAITQALASGKNVVFDGTKTYAVGSVITIPADAFVDFRGATIVPKGNHDVIRVMPGSFIENIIVRCGGVSGWDSAAIVLYGGDHFRATNPTKICNVKLYCNTGSTAGTTTQGIGIKLYGDEFGDFIEGITIEEAITHGFGVGILFEGVPEDKENPTDGIVFIGTNKFRGYWSFMDNCAINISSGWPRNHFTNNIFTDLQIEPLNTADKERQSSYGIFCEGFSNYFEGCLYDYFNNHTAIYFGAKSHRNVVKVTSGQLFSPNWYEDIGVCNAVTTFCQENKHLIPYTAITPSMLGNQDDCLAFIDRHSDCTLESFDGDPVSGTLSNVFNPTPQRTLRYRTINPTENNRRARITINCDRALRRLANLYLQFYRAPKNIKITFYNDVEATVVYDTDNNVSLLIGVCDDVAYGKWYEYNVAKIVVELGDFNYIEEIDGETYGEWELVRISAVDSYNSGCAWMRNDGGNVYGDIKFGYGNGMVLTDENGKRYKFTVSTSGVLETTEYVEPEEESPEVATLIPKLKAGAAWYDTDLAGVAQSEITSIVFNPAYVSTGTEDAKWACDEDSNGNIMAYRNGTTVTIKSTTGSEGVKLNENSSYMFANDGTNANFAALTEVLGTEHLKANKNTSVAQICIMSSKLTTFEHMPEGVTDMNLAFRLCSALSSAPALPIGLVNLANAFSACSNLRALPPIPHGVTNMAYTFNGCTNATVLMPTIPTTVTTMEGTFNSCLKLEGTVAVNAAGINSYSNCFKNAGRDATNGIVLTGSCPILADLAATADGGKVTVAS